MTIQGKSKTSWIHDKTMESKEQTANWIEERKRRIFNRKTLNKRIPILTWLPKYNKQDAIGDLVAGFTVGLTVIPQALAFAGIAGLPVEHGLYASFLGCIVYIFIGSSKDVPIGPTAMSALLVFQAAQGDWQKAVLLTFLTGIIEIFMGILQLGFLLDFVSGPVSAGFTSAVALLISSSQVKDIFGIKAGGPTFLKMWMSIFNNIHNLQLPDTLLGGCCIISLLVLREMSSLNIGPVEESARNIVHKIASKTFWLVGTSRNALLVITCAILGANSSLFTLVGYIPSGMPTFEVPKFSFAHTNNGTETIESFEEVTSSFGAALIIIPLISLLENMAVCTAFANGKAVDATQELLAIGASNVANSFVQGFCSTGGLARGAVQNASGVRTPLANLYTASIVMIALQFFTPCFSYIPKACLAAVIITAVIFMVQYKVVHPMWKSKKMDLIPGFCTFIACLVLRIQVGILVGIVINFIFILYQTARPKINVEKMFTPSGFPYLKVTPDRCLIFPSVEFVRSSINKEGVKCELPIVIDCTFIYGADFTAAKIISQLIKDFEKRSQKLLFFNLKPSVVQVFEGVSPDLANFYDIKELEMELAMSKVVYV